MILSANQTDFFKRINTKHLYNICAMLVQRLRRWSNIAQMLYKCFVFLYIHNTPVSDIRYAVLMDLLPNLPVYHNTTKMLLKGAKVILTVLEDMNNRKSTH